MAESRFSYFCLGLGIGTALGILFAPKTGEELRGELRSRANEGREYVKKRGTELRHQAEDALHRGRTSMQSQREQLSAALEAGKKAYREATQDQPETSSEPSPSS